MVKRSILETDRKLMVWGRIQAREAAQKKAANKISGLG